ncbi:MAG: DMT family transporter [Thermoplasmatales archaeon]
MNYKGNKALDIILFLAMSAAWALNYSFLKFALVYEPPMVALLFRALFGAIFSIPFSYATLRLVKSIGIWKLFIMSLLNVSIFMGLWFIGEQTESSSLSSILVYTYPIVSVFLSWLFLEEKLSAFKIVGIIIGFGGVIVIFLDELSIDYNIGLFLLIGSAVSWSAGTIYYKKYLRTADMGAVNTFQFVFAIPIVLVATIFYGGFKPLTLNFILITIYMGAIGSSAAYFIYWSLIKKYKVSHVSPYLFAVPALSILFSAFLNNNTLSVLNLAGFGLIAVGIFISSR